jgi:nitrite reductase/ring-hydroxylating ferredoxin subunit
LGVGGGSLPRFVHAAKLSRLEEGRGYIVSVEGIKVALFLCGSEVYAIKNQCPHMGGDLGEGLLTGDVIRCPWHGWKFSIKTGKMPETEVVAVRTYEVKIDGDDVLIGV